VADKRKRDERNKLYLPRNGASTILGTGLSENWDKTESSDSIRGKRVARGREN